MNDQRFVADVSDPDLGDPGLCGPSGECTVHIGNQTRAVEQTTHIGRLLPQPVTDGFAVEI